MRASPLTDSNRRPPPYHRAWEGATVRRFGSTKPKTPCREPPEKPAICGAVLPGCYLGSECGLVGVYADA
jgi:hypothetical protein